MGTEETNTGHKNLPGEKTQKGGHGCSDKDTEIKTKAIERRKL